MAPSSSLLGVVLLVLAMTFVRSSRAEGGAPAPGMSLMGGTLRFFPVNDVFRPLLADSKEPQFFMSLLKFKSPGKSYTVWSVGFGESLGLARWERGAFQTQLGLLAGVFSQFN